MERQESERRREIVGFIVGAVSLFRFLVGVGRVGERASRKVTQFSNGNYGVILLG